MGIDKSPVNAETPLILFMKISQVYIYIPIGKEWHDKKPHGNVIYIVTRTESVYQDFSCSGFADGGMDIQVIDGNYLSFYLFKLIVLIEITFTSTIPDLNTFIAL
jgi:hypothetical protein